MPPDASRPISVEAFELDVATRIQLGHGVVARLPEVAAARMRRPVLVTGVHHAERSGLRARIAALEDERNSLRLTLGLMCLEVDSLRNPKPPALPGSPMKCEICQADPSKDPVAIHRVSALGVFPSRWRCSDHLSDEQAAALPSEVKEICDTILKDRHSNP